MLSLTPVFIIGTYWLMRHLKDTIFTGTVGKDYLPWAKILSLCCVLPIVLGYAKLVDIIPKQKLFYFLCSFYSLTFLVIAYFLSHPHYGLANKDYSKTRLIGWIAYIAVESFGSLVISLFWSFVASNTDTKTSKKGYGFIILGAQIGSMTGPLVAAFGAKSLEGLCSNTYGFLFTLLYSFSYSFVCHCFSRSS